MSSIVLSIFLAASFIQPVRQSGPEAVLAEIEARYKWENIPKSLRPPIAIEQADAYVAAIKFMRDSAKKDLPRIEAIKPENDDRRLKSDKQRLANWVGNDLPRQLNESLQQTRQILQSEAMSKIDFVKFGAEIDMQDKDKVRNNLANPDNVALREEAIQDGMTALNLLVRLDEQLGEKSEWPARRKEFEGLAAKFHEKLSAAAAMIVPPKDIGDAELRKIAEATLKDPKYGAKEWKRLIVNAPKQHKEFSIYEVRENSIVRSDYNYDYFQATTIEPEGKDLFMFTNTLAYYNSGASTTPLKKWVVRERFRGARIVPENVDK
jgi:hypothetical protein